MNKIIPLITLVLLSACGSSSDIKCSKTEDGLTYDYSSTEQSDGSIAATCGITGAAGLQTSSSNHKQDSTHYSTKRCILVYDLDEPSTGLWTFQLDEGKHKAMYLDFASSLNGKTVTFEESDCQD